MATNCHHLLWPRKDFSQNRYSGELRKMLKFKINTKKHKELHKQCEFVAVPSELTCKLLIERLEALDYKDRSPHEIIWALVQYTCELPDCNAVAFSENIISQVPYLYDPP